MRKFLNNDILVQIVTIIQYCGICLLFIFFTIRTCIKNYIKERSEWINNMSKHNLISSYIKIVKTSKMFKTIFL